MRALATSGSRRVAALPELPTLKEAGIPVVVDAYWGIVAPAGTGSAIVGRLQESIAAALKHADQRTRLDEGQFYAVGSSPAQFEAFVQSEVARWPAVVKAAGVKVD